jgi:hypothetical protein
LTLIVTKKNLSRACDVGQDRRGEGEKVMLNAFLALCVAQAADCIDTGLEQVAWVRLQARGAEAVRREGVHVTEAALNNPKVMLTDDDLGDVARLQWCRKVGVGGV